MQPSMGGTAVSGGTSRIVWSNDWAANGHGSPGPSPEDGYVMKTGEGAGVGKVIHFRTSGDVRPGLF